MCLAKRKMNSASYGWMKTIFEGGSQGRGMPFPTKRTRCWPSSTLQRRWSLRMLFLSFKRHFVLPWFFPTFPKQGICCHFIAILFWSVSSCTAWRRKLCAAGCEFTAPLYSAHWCELCALLFHKKHGKPCFRECKQLNGISLAAASREEYQHHVLSLWFFSLCFSFSDLLWPGQTDK